VVHTRRQVRILDRVLFRSREQERVVADLHVRVQRWASSVSSSDRHAATMDARHTPFEAACTRSAATRAVQPLRCGAAGRSCAPALLGSSEFAGRCASNSRKAHTHQETRHVDRSMTQHENIPTSAALATRSPASLAGPSAPLTSCGAAGEAAGRLETARAAHIARQNN
jgi:hypothetical protein